MAGQIYKQPILFAIVATVVILVGTVVTMFYPMITPEMHPKLENLKPYTALQLAGKDFYQREGCLSCHTQTVRPLKTEVMRYGEYSKAGEFAYDRPFLWGSKRTGPDLARIGGKYPDAWHYRHFENPLDFHKQSNMPVYGWMKTNRLDPAEMEARMKANGFPYTKEEIAALATKTELDALVAYMQVIGIAVKKKPSGDSLSQAKRERMTNPLSGDPKAIEIGRKIYKDSCSSCHGDNGEGGIGPSVIDKEFLYVVEDVPDDAYFVIIADGTSEGIAIEGRKAKGGMPPYSSSIDRDKIWATVTFIRSIQK